MVQSIFHRAPNTFGTLLDNTTELDTTNIFDLRQTTFSRRRPLSSSLIVKISFLSGLKVCDSSGIQTGPLNERNFPYRYTNHRSLYDTIVNRCPYKQQSMNLHIWFSFHSCGIHIKRSLTSPKLKLQLASACSIQWKYLWGARILDLNWWRWMTWSWVWRWPFLACISIKTNLMTHPFLRFSIVFPKHALDVNLQKFFWKSELAPFPNEVFIERYFPSQLLCLNCNTLWKTFTCKPCWT